MSRSVFVECRCSTPQRLGAVGLSEPFVRFDRDLERCARALRQAVLKGAVGSSLAGGGVSFQEDCFARISALCARFFAW